MESRNGLIQWFLEGELRDNSPWIIPINNLTFCIGRLDSSDLILSSSSVSRKHAELIIQKDDLYITDLNSKNGTYINGRLQKERTLLRDGDILQIGNNEFKICTKVTELEVEGKHTIIGMNETEHISFADKHLLSDREEEVLFFLVKGMSLKVIGEKLFISPGTVKNHVLNIYKKTNCHSRIELSTAFSEYQ
jgi:DNA-binding CsgD family transcriptional regulator